MSKSPFRPALKRALAHALDHLESLDTARVSASADLADLRRRLCRPTPEKGMDPAAVIDDLVSDTAGGLLGSAGGRFFGWVIGGSVPAALGADWLASAWDQNAALYACSPAAAVVEEACGAWLKDLLGLPASAGFALVSGCQMAHVTCLAVARHALLERAGWDVERRGLAGAPAIRIVSGSHLHESFTRAARLVGLGTDAIVDLPLDDAGRLQPATLDRALTERPGAPTILVLQAGDINCGAFDPFADLVPMARAHDAWVHVDGAFGLWAAASPAHRHLVEGVDGADSWATDGHKWLNVPYDSGYAFVADAAAHRAALSQRASYLTHDDDARDQMDYNPEWSRRARGVPTYAAIRSLGRKGIAEIVERCCRCARRIVAGIEKLDGAEVLWAPTLNQGLVRFPNPRPGAAGDDHDRRTNAVIAAILDDGEAFFGGTTWNGMRCMRVSVCNWQTTEADADRAVACVSRAQGRVATAT